MDNLHTLFVQPNARITTTQEKLNDFLSLVKARNGVMQVKCLGETRGITWARVGNSVVVSTYKME